MSLVEGPAERYVPVCAYRDEIVEREDLGIPRNIK